MGSYSYDASEDEEMAAFLCATHLAAGYAIPMTLKAVIELGVLDIIAEAGPGCQLSPAEIASKIVTTNPQAPVVLNRILRYLASSCVLTCSAVAEGESGRVGRRYGLAPIAKFFVGGGDHNNASLAPLILMNQHKARQASWQELKYAVLDGVLPFKKAHGMSQFEYLSKNPELNRIFNNGMSCTSTLLLKKIVESYNGFQGIGKLVDVGGGTGSNLQMIVSKFPHIKGINFDLPYVIAEAPPIPGVEHVTGDMFDNIPCADAIFMKWILHDWDDEDCLKILKNCLKALPDSGKVIVFYFIIPEAPEDDPMTQIKLYGDLCLLNFTTGGKERMEKELEILARKAGFSEFKVVPCAFGILVMELLK